MNWAGLTVFISLLAVALETMPWGILILIVLTVLLLKN